LLCVFLALSCEGKRKEEGKIRIGFSAATDLFSLERWDKDIRVFSNVARELGAEVTFAKSPGNALSQIPQIQYLLDHGIDVLVVIPQDMDLLGGIIKKAMNKGIPVLCYDRPVMQVPISGFISFDNREVGKLLASALVSKAPRGRYLIVNGSIHDNNSFELNEGVHKVLDPLIKRRYSKRRRTSSRYPAPTTSWPAPPSACSRKRGSPARYTSSVRTRTSWRASTSSTGCS
jgi:D-xylose transport system substrate-binding protein